jgi:DNA-binding NarL/FixJ family response regulator
VADPAKGALIPGSPEQIAARKPAMNRLVQAIAASIAAGERVIPVTAIDDLAACFAMPVTIEVDWDGTAAAGSPTIMIRAARPREQLILRALSAREREVAQLIAAGLTNREISERLGIAVTTVKDHVHHILVRAGFRNRNALAAALRGHGTS